MTILDRILDNMKHSILAGLPDTTLIEDAKTLTRLCKPDELPDWIRILAGGNPALPAEVADVAKADILADEAVSRD